MRPSHLRSLAQSSTDMPWSSPLSIDELKRCSVGYRHHLGVPFDYCVRRRSLARSDRGAQGRGLAPMPKANPPAPDKPLATIENREDVRWHHLLHRSTPLDRRALRLGQYTTECKIRRSMPPRAMLLDTVEWMHRRRR
jgi:hypothetical protein